MELLYVYIKNYLNLHSDQEINVHPNYKFEYKNGKLYKLDSKKKYNIFSDKIKSCKAIIGENGSGKTSVLKYIFKSFNIHDERFSRIIVFKSNDGYLYFSDFDVDIEFKAMRINSQTEIFDNVSVAYYSPAFRADYNNYFSNTSILPHNDCNFD